MCTKAFLLFFICIAGCCYCYSQGRISSIKGVITDSVSGETLEQASVSLVRRSDSIVVRQVLSGKYGFEFRRISTGNYWLTVSFISYRTDTLMLNLGKPDSIYSIGSIQLVKTSANLVEVVVRSVIPPVIVKNDTMIYNASAFKTQHNATVEDLLKKLPGIEVDKDGNVTIQGKKVEKIYIDGKEFFLNDPKMATQNLTADMVDAVEAFDNQSDRARFTGIKEPNVNKAINLRLKKDRKKGLFGNAAAAAGTRNSYSGGATATYFKEDRWAFANLAAGYSDNLAAGSGQVQLSSNGSLNYREDLGTKAMLVINYSGGSSRSKSGQSNMRETFLDDSSLTQDRDAFNTGQSENKGFNNQLTYNIDSFNSAVYSSSLSFQKSEAMNSDSSFVITQKPDSSYLSNKGRTMNNLSSDDITINNSGSFRRRFKKKGRSFYATLTHSYRQQKQDGKLYSSVKFYDNSGSVVEDKTVDQEYDQRNHGNHWGLNIVYTEPIKVNQIIDIGYNLSTSSNSSGKKAFNYNSATDRYDIPDTLTTNQFTNSNTQQNFNIGYNYIGKAVQYQLGLNVLYSSLKNQSDNQKYATTEQHLLNWSPRASAFYRLTRQKNLQVQYSSHNRAPTTQMLQPIPDLSNPYLINVGNPGLKQQFQHSIHFNYNSSNTATFSNFSAQLGGDYTTNKIVQSSIITGGVQELKYINVNGVYTVNSNMDYGFSLNKAKNGSGQFSVNVQYNRDLNLVNGERNIHKALTLAQGFSLNYHTKNKLYAGLAANIHYNRSSYSIGTNLNTELFSQQYAANITYTLPFSIRISSNFSIQINGKQGNLPGKTIAAWNATVSRTIFRNNKGLVRFSAFDLLNRNTGFRQATGDNYIETRENNVLKRYFVLGLQYNFRAAAM